MDSTDTKIEEDNKKAVKDIKNMFESRSRQNSLAGSENLRGQPVKKALKSDNDWMKRNKKEDEEVIESKVVEQPTPKKVLEQIPPVDNKSDNVVKEELDAKANIKKFEEIARRNSEKQKFIRDIDEKKAKKLEATEGPEKNENNLPSAKKT